MLMKNTRIILFLSLALCISPINAKNAFNSDDIYSIKDISLEDVSNDAKSLVFITSQADKKSDEFKKTLYFLDIHSGKKVKLLEQLAEKGMDFSSVRFSKDSKLIYFLSSGLSPSKKSNVQIWSLSLSNKIKRRITNFDGNIIDFDFSPNEETIAFIGRKEPQEMNEGKTKPPIVIDRYQFKRDYEDFLGSDREHLFLFNTLSKEIKKVTSGQKDVFFPSISPDGQRVAYVTKEGEFDRHNNWDIFIADIHGDNDHIKLTSHEGEDSSPAWDSRPQWSPDGKKIAYLFGGDHSMLWYALQEVSVIDVESGKTEFITSHLDRNTSMPEWSQDGKNMYYVLEDDMKSQLIKYSLDTETIEEVTPENMYLNYYSKNYFVNDGKVIFLSSSVETPSEIYLLEDGIIKALTSENKEFIDNKYVGSTEIISYESFDGLTINGMMIKPHDFDPKKKYPLIIRIHGGPVSQYGRDFDFDWQLYASNDYIVMITNPRGSSGRGFEFQKSIFAKWGIEDSKDISAALDFALTLDYIDENRLGIGGWSYGSMLTNYVIAKDDRFDAATSGAGISNLLSGFGDDQYIREYIIELGTPWDNLDTWLNVSHPFLNADKIVTPTLFLVGEKDYNVPLIGSEQMYQALKHLEIPTQLIIYPDQHHGLSKPSYIKDRLDRYLDWYEKYLMRDN